MYFKRLFRLFFRILVGAEPQILPESRVGRLKAALIIALPVMVQNLVRHLQIVIDRAFLGNLDALYLSVIGNVMVPYGALDLFLFATGTGLAVLTAQAVGAAQYERARLLAESSYALMPTLSLMIFVFWQFGSEGVFQVLGTAENLAVLASQYTRTLSFSSFFSVMDITSASLLAACGLSGPILITGLLKNVLNLLLDWILIFGNLGFPALGVRGAAWATVIANGIGAITLTLMVFRGKGLPFRVSPSGLWRPSVGAFLETLKVGLPSGLETFLWFFGQTFVLGYMNALGPYETGIYTLAHDIYILALFVYMGFSRSTLTLVGQFWGAGRYREGRLAGLEGQVVSTGISLIWAGILFFAGGGLLAMFTKDERVIHEGARLMQVAGGFVVFQSFNVVTGNAIRATGDTLWMLWTQIFGTVFVIVVTQLFVFQLGWGLLGVVWALTLDELIRGAANALRFFIAPVPKEWSISVVEEEQA